MSSSQNPEKWVWTHADFHEMSWHDSVVHGFAFSDERELLIDLDYILEWVKPGSTGDYQFWLAPCTLVFENAHHIHFDLRTDAGLQLAQLTRSEPRELKSGLIEWEWTLLDVVDAGAVTLRATGFQQHIRASRVLTTRQSLTLLERGGVSFARSGRAPSDPHGPFG